MFPKFGDCPRIWEMFLGGKLRWKDSPLPREYVLWLMGAIVVFELLPYAEEFARTVRAKLRAPLRPRVHPLN